MSVIALEEVAKKPTKRAFFWSIILNAPFWAMYGYLPFILLQELGASPLQITLLISLKPIVSLFSIYWSSHVVNRGDRLVPNIMGATLLGHLPILFFPFVDNVWYFVAASALYTMMERGGKPAWMEVLKLNLGSNERQKLFSRVSTCSYGFGMLAPCFFGYTMDVVQESWRWIFVGVSLLSITSLFFQYQIPIFVKNALKKEPLTLLKPWKGAFHVMKQRKDFRKFQLGFFLGGAGAMIIMPALPPFFMSELKLSYTELAIALSLCKGLGFAATSSFWARWMSKVDLFRLIGCVTAVMACVPLCLMWGTFWVYSIYLAFILYGVMQAGSELSWHLSGPLFAEKEDSSLFTSVNILMVGIRGLIFPALGTYLIALFNPYAPLVVGALLSMSATYSMLKTKRAKAALDIAA